MHHQVVCTFVNNSNPVNLQQQHGIEKEGREAQHRHAIMHSRTLITYSLRYELNLGFTATCSSSIVCMGETLDFDSAENADNSEIRTNFFGYSSVLIWGVLLYMYERILHV